MNLRLILSAGCVIAGLAAARGEDHPANWVPPILSPEEELKTFQLPDGYRMELVESEPAVQQPVLCVFDGNGRMYVAEMRSYMRNIDGAGERAPESRISRYESTKGDGDYDRHTVFADHLILPRMVLPLGRDQIVVGFTDTNDLTLYRDTQGTGVADSHELFYQGGPFAGNLEHQPSGLLWSIDNWIYMTYNAYRLRWRPGAPPLKEPTAANGGQWGVTQDDYGKLWFSNAGGEKPVLHFQTHVLYAGIDVPGQEEPGFDEVWPAVGLADFQGGLKRVREPEQTLNHFTASAGQEVYRGDRLPADLRGDILLDEPVGRLIRRARIAVRDGVTVVSNVYQAEKSEFLRSTDPYFRPVNITTGPDGCLYIVDMYRGIIQEGAWVRPGSYLRGIVEQHDLQDNVGRGRIWRLVHRDFTPGPPPHMLDETPAQLVAHLSHPNGWWRDTAQKLLVLRQDRSVVPALRALALDSADPLARLHALWTLEGLGALDDSVAGRLLRDPDPHLRAGAIRASESLFKAGDGALKPTVESLFRDPDPNVALQAIMTAKLLNWPGWRETATPLITTSSSVGLREIGGQVLRPKANFKGLGATPEQIKLLERGQVIFEGLCFACHNVDGKGTPIQGPTPGATLAPPLARAATVLGPPEGVLSILLHGLSGPVDGKTYDAQMIPMGENDDEWIAAVVSYVRNAFGNRASIIAPADVGALRRATAGRTAPWTLAEIKSAVLPQPLGNAANWKFSASDGSPTASAVDSADPEGEYTSVEPQAPGLWFQVELPEPDRIAGLSFDAGKGGTDFPLSFEVEASMDGKSWGAPVAKGKGVAPINYVQFKPMWMRFIRIVEKTEDTEGRHWSIRHLDVLAPSPLNL